MEQEVEKTEKKEAQEWNIYDPMRPYYEAVADVIRRREDREMREWCEKMNLSYAIRHPEAFIRFLGDAAERHIEKLEWENKRYSTIQWEPPLRKEEKRELKGILKECKKEWKRKQNTYTHTRFERLPKHVRGVVFKDCEFTCTRDIAYARKRGAVLENPKVRDAGVRNRLHPVRDGARPPKKAVVRRRSAPEREHCRGR